MLAKAMKTIQNPHYVPLLRFVALHIVTKQDQPSRMYYYCQVKYNNQVTEG
jgi:hypothetical protein